MNSLVRNTTRLRFFTSSLRIIPNHHQRLLSSKEIKGEEIDPDQPIKFLGSEAQKWKAKTLRVGTNDPDDFPWFQPLVVVGSVAVFLLYFCVFREENDIDAHLNKPIFDTVPQLEKSTLIGLYKHNLEKNIDNTDVIKRMLEIGVDPMKIE